MLHSSCKELRLALLLLTQVTILAGCTTVDCPQGTQRVGGMCARSTEGLAAAGSETASSSGAFGNSAGTMAAAGASAIEGSAAAGAASTAAGAHAVEAAAGGGAGARAPVGSAGMSALEPAAGASAGAPSTTPAMAATPASGAAGMSAPACTPSTETCDGLDNDCDAKIDETIPPMPCGNITPPCRQGAYRCENGRFSTTCEGEIKPSPETCDATDNDCDGRTDESVLNECGGCTRLVNPPGTRCTAGRFACMSTGSYRCRGQNNTECDAIERPGTSETCDFADNDCDGRTDEGLDNGCRGPCTATLSNRPGTRCTVTNPGTPPECGLVGAWQCNGTTAVRCEAPTNAPTVGSCGCTYGCSNAATGESKAVVSRGPPNLGPEWLCVPASPNCT